MLLVHQQPRRAANRIRIFARRICDREAEIFWNISCRKRGGDRFQRRFNKFAGRIFHLCVRHFVLCGVNQFHVADRPRRLLYLARDALVPLAADPSRPIDGSIIAGFLLPFPAHFAEVIGEDKRCSTAIRSVHDHDLLIGQLCA